MKIKSFHLFQRFHHTYFFFLSLQILIFAVTILIWLFNRGNAFVKTFMPEEYITDSHAVVSQDVSIENTTNESCSFLQTPLLSLEKGIYLIRIDYNASDGGSYVSAATSQLNSLELHTSDIQLSPANHTAFITVELSRDVTDFSLEAIFSGHGNLSITGISIAETSGLYKKNLFYAGLLCLFINLLWLFKRADASGRKVIYALSVIFLAVCYPLYTDYLTVGHDIPFHLMRIEGITEGLKTGNALPIKIHPVWARGYGYAVGVLYGDALLYFPAILRLLGFTVQAAYKYFVAAINLGTVVISYFSFKRMFSSKKIGVLGSLIYSASLYRLADIYTRASVGEYCAMMFLPLILCGFYLSLMEADEKNWHKYALITALGLTGLIQNHVLSCEMAAIVVLLTCLLSLRRVFRRYAFQALAAAFLLTLLLNLGFLVPFVDYYSSDLNITSDQWAGGTTGSFQENGLLPIQLFSLFQHSNGGAWSIQAGVSNEVTMGTGILFLLALLLFGYLLLCHYKECQQISNFRPAVLCMGLGSLLLFMSTCLFPWDDLVSMGEGAKTIIYSLQFPWRFLSFATVLLTFGTCFTISVLPSVFKKEAFQPILMIMMLLFSINCGWYFYDFSFNNIPYRVFNTSELDSMSMYTYDYLPTAVDPALIVENITMPQNMEVPDFYEKSGVEITCHAVTGDLEGYIDFPLNYYKYYRCTDMVTGEQLPVSSGYNGMLRVTFPAHYDSTFRIAFTEPWFWRLAEVISLLTLPVCFGLALSFRCFHQKKAPT